MKVLRPIGALSALLLWFLALPSAGEALTVALGVAPVFELRKDFGADYRFVFAPELVGQTYFALGGSRFFLRPGLRLGLDNPLQAEMPRALSVSERGFTTLGEVALLRDGFLVPTLSLGGGMLARWIRIETGPGVRPAPAARSFELRPVLYAQLGLGVPLARGRVVVEPFARVAYVHDDTRSLWRLGIESTVAF